MKSFSYLCIRELRFALDSIPTQPYGIPHTELLKKMYICKTFSLDFCFNRLRQKLRERWVEIMK